VQCYNLLTVSWYDLKLQRPDRILVFKSWVNIKCKVFTPRETLIK